MYHWLIAKQYWFWLGSNCVLISKARREADYDAIPVARKIDNPENAIFEITDTTLCVPVFTLSKENDTKLFEQLKTGFKRTIKWNKCRPQMNIQPQNSNLNYLIDPTFTNINTFVLSFTTTNAGDDRDSFSDYYVPDVEIKYFNVLIDGKGFFDLPVKKWRRGLQENYWHEQ